MLLLKITRRWLLLALAALAISAESAEIFTIRANFGDFISSEKYLKETESDSGSFSEENNDWSCGDWGRTLSILIGTEYSLSSYREHRWGCQGAGRGEIVFRSELQHEGKVLWSNDQDLKLISFNRTTNKILLEGRSDQDRFASLTLLKLDGTSLIDQPPIDKAFVSKDLSRSVYQTLIGYPESNERYFFVLGGLLLNSEKGEITFTLQLEGPSISFCNPYLTKLAFDAGPCEKGMNFLDPELLLKKLEQIQVQDKEQLILLSVGNHDFEGLTIYSRNNHQLKTLRNRSEIEVWSVPKPEKGFFRERMKLVNEKTLVTYDLKKLGSAWSKDQEYYQRTRLILSVHNLRDSKTHSQSAEVDLIDQVPINIQLNSEKIESVSLVQKEAKLISTVLVAK